MTDLNHMDSVINCDSIHYEEESDSDDSSIILTKVVPSTGRIDGDDNVMIIGTRNCVDQKIQFKIHKDLQDSSIDHTEHTTEDDEHESSDGELCVIT